MAGVLSSIFDPDSTEQQRDRDDPAAVRNDGDGGDAANPDDDGAGASGGRVDGAFLTPHSSGEAGGPETVDLA